MSKLTQLRELRNSLSKQANEINNSAPADQRLSDEQSRSLDDLLARIEAIDGDISRQKRVAELALENEDANAIISDMAKSGVSGRNDSPGVAAIRSYLIGGIQGLSDAQRNEMFGRRNADIRAAMSTTSGAEGGYTTSPIYIATLQEAMKSFGGMRSVAYSFNTSTGSELTMPTADATNEEGEIVGQNAAVSKGETTFGTANILVFKYSSKFMALPFELLQDAEFNIEEYINRVLGLRLARITNRHFTVGTGSNEPKGIVTGATEGKRGLTGQTSTVTYDDLVDLEHSVDPAYRGNATWMMHDDTLKSLRKIKDGQNRPIFAPGYESSNPGGAPDRIMGRTFTINQHMPAPQASAKSLLFGDFSKYMIRNVMDLTFFRMTDSAFTRNGQVGFLAFARYGGNLIDVGGAVKFYQNSAS